MVSANTQSPHQSQCECGWELPPKLLLLTAPNEVPYGTIVVVQVACPRCSPNASGVMVTYSMKLERAETGSWWRWILRK
jgi:hypothetical protein